MLNLYKMSEEEKREYNFSEEDNYYFFKNEQDLLGFAKINYLKNPDIYLFIFEEKRGNGYGNALFSKVLEKLKENKIRSFEVVIPLKNAIMARILKNHYGIEESRKDNLVKYTIVIR